MTQHAMPNHFARSFALFALVTGLFSFAPQIRIWADDKKTATTEKPTFTAQQVAAYEKEVLPVLQKNCLKCHGAEEKVKGDLNLTNRKAILVGGDSGAAVDLKNPDQSLLLKAIHYKDENCRMPPKSKLSNNEIAILEKWVKDGLPVTADRLGDGEIAKQAAKGGVVTEEAKRYWAYQPVKRSTVPEVTDKSWVKTPIDAFILAKLEAKGLKPVKPAEKAALARVRITI